MFDYMDSDFWDEPSESDELIYNFKEALRKEVKQEVKDKIERLEKELADLKEFREEKEQYDNRINQLENKLKKTESEVEEKAKQLKLNEFLTMIESPAWCVHGDWEYLNPKCDKCDDSRTIHFLAPSGKEHTESCPYCSQRRYTYRPEEAVLVYMKEKELKRIKEYEMNGVELIYVHKHQLNEYFKTDYDYTEIRRCYNGEDVSKLNNYDANHMYFRNLEDCQKVCDYLNSEVDLI